MMNLKNIQSTLSIAPELFKLLKPTGYAMHQQV